MRRALWSSVLTLPLALLACGGGGASDSGADAPASESAPVDALAPESALGAETSVGDSGGADASTLDAPAPDAPSLDAAPADAPPRDAPAPDAPPRDAPAPADAGSGLASILSATDFEAFFPHRGTAPCRGAFYTYAALLEAARSFPLFASEGTTDQRRRELAAFLANAGHETTGGWATAPDGPYAWGLCWITEGGTTPDSALPAYCDGSNTTWPCAAGHKYYGRGPLQLSWNYNYGQAGAALGLPLLATPEMVAADPVVAWRTALWFWMTPQAPKPSCHAVMTGGYTPSAVDTAAGRLPGFGLTVNIINGGLECNQPTPPQVTDRVGFYNRFATLLGVSPGPNLTCDTQRSY